MSLSFDVDALVRAGRDGKTLHMGLSRVADEDWLKPDFDRAARARAFDEYPQAVRVLPGAETAALEAARLVHPGAGSLAEAARHCWEDLCVLEPEAPGGPYRLTAAALGFPTDWYLDQKLGLPLVSIHVPIHGYAEQLAAGVDHFFATAATGPIFGRANWFVVSDPAWRYLPQDEAPARFAHVTPENAGETLFVRCERQTLRRLPQSGAMLFTICVAVAPLSALSATAVRIIATKLAQISRGEFGRRGAPYYAAQLTQHIDAREAAGEMAE